MVIDPVAFDYTAACAPVRDDIQDAQRAFFEHLRRPGTWWSGAERIALAAESRRAVDCGLCRRRKEALSPTAVDGAHDTLGDLLPLVVDVVHRVRTDSGRLSRAWFDTVIAGGVSIPRYVELVGVVAMLAGVDAFTRALGIAPFPLPAPLDGAPSGALPRAAKPGVAWVPLIAPADASDEPDLYPADVFVPNIMRALSLVPSEARMLQQMSAAHYMPIDRIPDVTFRRTLDRTQIELVAARVSALNQCFY